MVPTRAAPTKVLRAAFKLQFLFFSVHARNYPNANRSQRGWGLLGWHLTTRNAQHLKRKYLCPRRVRMSSKLNCFGSLPSHSGFVLVTPRIASLMVGLFGSQRSWHHQGKHESRESAVFHCPPFRKALFQLRKWVSLAHPEIVFSLRSIHWLYAFIPEQLHVLISITLSTWSNQHNII